MKKRKRIHSRHKNGWFNKDAPFWRGERAEQIVKERVLTYTKKRIRRKAK